MKTVDNFYLTKIIGGGAYGTVYLCKIKKEDRIEPDTRERMRPGKRVACKMIKQKNIKSKIKKYLIQEIEIMMSIKHENILRFLEAKKTTNNIYIFFEFCNGGDLRRFLDVRGGKLDEKITKVIISQIGKGLNHLNENKSMHRDLKLDNILLNFPEYDKEGTVSDEYLKEFDPTKEKMEVIIGDLGFARSLGNSSLAESYCGTPLNMAPEIMNGVSYDTKVDIWSLGTMMYELLVGFTPFTGNDPHDLADRVNEGNYGVPKHIKLSLPCLELLHRCLQFSPKKRIGHKDLLNHPFLEEDDNQADMISLSCSQGPDQRSFFDMPSSGFDINKENAVIFNARDSCLFNGVYQNTLKKFQQKQEEVKDVEVPDEPENEEENQLPEVEFVENDDDDFSSFELKAGSLPDEEEEKGITMDANGKVEVMRSNKKSTQQLPPKEEEPAVAVVPEQKEASPKRDSVKKITPSVKDLEKEKPEEVIVAPAEEPEEAHISPEKPKEIGEKSLIEKLEEEEKAEESNVDIPDSDDDEFDDGMNFTIVDYPLQPIAEMPSGMETSTNQSVVNSTNKKPTENGQKVEESDDDLNDSFEIVHYHDVQIIEKDYLIQSSKAF